MLANSTQRVIYGDFNAENVVPRKFEEILCLKNL